MQLLYVARNSLIKKKKFLATTHLLLPPYWRATFIDILTQSACLVMVGANQRGSVGRGFPWRIACWSYEAAEAQLEQNTA